MVKLEEVQNNKKKDIIMTIRTTKEDSQWMKEHKISPSLLFEKALEELKEKVRAKKDIEDQNKLTW